MCKGGVLADVLRPFVGVWDCDPIVIELFDYFWNVIYTVTSTH